MSQENRIYLECPFEDKEHCKDLGGKWDAKKSKWYVPSEKNVFSFSRWLPREPIEEYSDLALSSEAGTTSGQESNDPFQLADDAVSRGDYQMAIDIWRPIAEAGDAVAQYCLGNLYEDGCGVRQDRRVAARWYTKSAQQGFCFAQRDLADLYLQGSGVKKSSQKAYYWYELGANQGDILAQLNLGVMYCNGDGIPENIEEGMKWLRAAAYQGSARAQMYLGVMYEIEANSSQDFVRSLMWFNIAASSDNRFVNGEAAAKRDAIGVIMTSGQIAQAESMAEAFLQRNSENGGRQQEC